MRSTTDQNPLPIVPPNTTGPGTLVGIARLAASAGSSATLHCNVDRGAAERLLV